VVSTGPPPVIFVVFVVFGSAVTLVVLGYVLEGLQYSAAAYITALTIDFFTVIFGFVIALDVIGSGAARAASSLPIGFGRGNSRLGAGISELRIAETDLGTSTRVVLRRGYLKRADLDLNYSRTPIPGAGNAPVPSPLASLLHIAGDFRTSGCTLRGSSVPLSAGCFSHALFR